MILHHSTDPVSARWINDHWDISERKNYSWVDNNNKVVSDLFYDIKDALDWIIEYDRSRCILINEIKEK